MSKKNKTKGEKETNARVLKKLKKLERIASNDSPPSIGYRFLIEQNIVGYSAAY